MSMLPILMLAVFGTAISTFVVGLGLFFCFGGLTGMTLVEALMFGALIRYVFVMSFVSACKKLFYFVRTSAVDPVATLAVFHSLDVNHTLHMLVS